MQFKTISNQIQPVKKNIMIPLISPMRACASVCACVRAQSMSSQTVHQLVFTLAGKTQLERELAQMFLTDFRLFDFGDQMHINWCH